MEFNYSYKGSSALSSTADQTSMAFVPDARREPTYFRGELGKQVEFREAISALHDVVVSDLRWKPKDRTTYLAWRAQQDDIDWTAVAAENEQIKQEIAKVRGDLSQLQGQFATRWKPFYAARQLYFDFLWKKDRDAWYVLDPVITVHPDEIAFECFSQDESSYGRLATSYGVYKNVGEHACGTTNIDYSQALYDEFQKIRSYKATALDVDPSGFEVKTTHEESYREVKIDLPDTWVRGFLQVSSAMALPAAKIELHPLDIHNLLFVLRRNKELKGPRGVRFELRAGRPITIRIEPWDIEVKCPRSIYRGSEDREIRMWGRRRLYILERLIPVARSFTVHLLGSGMPSFWVADLGDMTFTLGLSGWTANDWSRSGNFDLMAPRTDVDDMTKARVFAGLKETWFETPDALAKRLEISRDKVLGALGAYTQAGRAIYDLSKGVYRVRELTQDPLPMESLRFQSPREEKAIALLSKKDFSLTVRGIDATTARVDAKVTVRGRPIETVLVLDSDQRMREAHCGCNFYQQNRLYKGPCEHILAARVGLMRGLAKEGAAEVITPPKPAAKKKASAAAAPEPETAPKAAPTATSQEPAREQTAKTRQAAASKGSSKRSTNPLRAIGRFVGSLFGGSGSSGNLAEAAAEAVAEALRNESAARVTDDNWGELRAEIQGVLDEASDLETARSKILGLLVNSKNVEVDSMGYTELRDFITGIIEEWYGDA